MKTFNTLSDAELLHTTRLHVQGSHERDAELLLLLGEIDGRRLYLEHAFTSLFDFCTGELRFSEDVAYNRVKVAGLVRRFPRVLDVVRTGQVHLTGLRLLEPHLTEENLEAVLAEASGKSKRYIEELVARLAPQPPVPPSIRKLPAPAPRSSTVEPTPALPLLTTIESPTVELPALVHLLAEVTPVEAPSPAPLSLPQSRRAEVKPLSEDAFLVKFTANRALKAKLEKAEELMRHRVDKGDYAAVIDRALDLLIDEVTKERFGVGRKPRSTVEEAEQRDGVSRHVPAAILRAVHERDGGQCTYRGPDGRRCQERGGLELEHIEGFARTGRHTVEGLTLHCKAHNQHCADKLYGRDFMEAKRRRTGTENRRTGSETQEALL